MTSTFAFTNPMQLQLTISTPVQQDAWQASQPISTPGGRWQAYLNQMSLRVISDEFTTSGPDLDGKQSISPWPTADIAPTAWELVNGSVITMGRAKIAIIPSEGLDQDGLEVPQEWVDIPSRAADYFLAVRIDPRESWLECWGYTTHQQLKALGDFDVMDRTYTLDADALTQDISALYAILEYCPQTASHADLEPVPALSLAQLTQSIQRLSHRDLSFPRLSVPFAQWSAIMADDQSWTTLCTQRLANDQSVGASTEENTDTASEWLQRLQTNIQEIFQRWQSPLQNASYSAAFRSDTEQTENQNVNAPQQLLSQQKEIQLNQVVILLSIECEVNDEGLIEASFELRPVGDAIALPFNLAVALLSAQGEVLATRQAQSQDSVLQLTELTFEMGDRFLLAISLSDSEYRDVFEA